jgi:photosystem II stability/assembly factor-like uncharacterized protein
MPFVVVVVLPSHCTDYIYTSTDSGLSWTQQTASVPSGHTVSWYSIASSSDGDMLAAIPNSVNGTVYTSIDSGVTWNESPNTFDGTLQSISSSSNGCKLVLASYDG